MALLGDDGDVPQRARQHGGAERLLCRRVMPQERQHLVPEPSSRFHHKGHELRVRVVLRWVPLALLVGSDARRLASGTSVAERSLISIFSSKIAIFFCE